MSVQQRPVCKTARTPRHRDADNVKTLGKWFNVLQQKWNCTVTVSLIYIKITADKCIYTNPPFHSDSLAPTHPLPSPCPSGSPRRGITSRALLKRQYCSQSPPSPGLGRDQLTPTSTTAVFQVSQGQCSELSVDF